jgi:hypothetical protein
MRAVGGGIRAYAELIGRLPPSAGPLLGAPKQPRDERHLHSWRVALMPFIEEQSAYRKLHRDEPWDSPHNKSLLENVPQCYRLLWSDDPPGVTHCQAFVGPGTAFEREGITLKDFSDGLANTILVAEATKPVPWARPGDLVYDPDEPLPPLGGLYRKPVDFLGYTVSSEEGFTAAFADGSARFISAKTDEKVLRALITRNGGD